MDASLPQMCLASYVKLLSLEQLTVPKLCPVLMGDPLSGALIQKAPNRQPNRVPVGAQGTPCPHQVTRVARGGVGLAVIVEMLLNVFVQSRTHKVSLPAFVLPEHPRWGSVWTMDGTLAVLCFDLCGCHLLLPALQDLWEAVCCLLVPC